MRILVHNFLQCPVRNCQQNYPLTLQVDEWVQDTPAPTYSRSAVIRLLPKVEWSCLLQVARSFSLPESESLPKEKPDDNASDSTLQSAQMALLGRQVKTGKMTCPGCGHVYPITDSIPNMLLNEDEI